MENILNIVTANLIMIGCFLIPFVLIRIADIVLGVSIAQKNSITFDWKKFLWGVFYSICNIIGIGCFVTAVSVIVPLIEYYNIALSEETVSGLETISVTAVVLLIIGATVMTYGKDCFEKIKTITGKK